MTVQDDQREEQLVDVFELSRPSNRKRAGLDAYLELDGQQVPFEVKSTTSGAVTTVRDFGQAHLDKWKGKHWLIGVYEPNTVKLLYSLYGSPSLMEPWIREKEEYIRADRELAIHVPALIGLPTLFEILGRKSEYTIEDARRLHKRQWKVEEYRAAMDLKGGYSPERMLEILRDRARYVLQRGATLNNPHIPKTYFKEFEQITTNRAARLRELVAEEL
jgi:hypothetical protein